jgi:ferrous iron transport protein A
MKKLSQLKIGEGGVITNIEGEELLVKLMEMGCIPGEEVTVENLALTGDPMSVQIAGYHLSLRLAEADQIIVKTH